MADDQKEDAKPANQGSKKTDGDEKAAVPDKKPAPINDPKVKVNVQPTKDKHSTTDPVTPDHAKKIKESVEKEVKKAIKETKDGGAPAQIQKVKETVKERQEQLREEGKPVRIDVNVQGETSDGKKVDEDFSAGGKQK